MKSALVASLAAAMACSNCGQDGSRVRAYATAHAAALVTATRPLWTAGKVSGVEIPLTDCPESVKAVEPSRVVAVPDGVFIYVYTGFADLTAIFVRHNPEFSPPGPPAPDPDGPTFEPLGQDVYWYSIPR